MEKIINNPFLILASESPRRKYLLEQAGLSFTVIPAGFDESSIEITDPESYVKILANAKAGEISEKYPESWVIGADTIVVIGNTILGKPGSQNQAREMLKRLSGQTHQVFTGYAICCKARNRIFSEAVKILANAKAGEISEKYPESWVIGADTIVVIGNTILGKPSSQNQAREMLKRLSGQTHQVFTGYAICCKARNRIFSEAVKTDVIFKNLTDEEIEWYVNTREPFDKAGAYAIQGLGTFLVKSIKGSYTNVVGLPVCEVIEVLIREGVLGRSIENGANYLEVL